MTAKTKLLPSGVAAAKEAGWLRPDGSIDRDALDRECKRIAAEDPQISEFQADREADEYPANEPDDGGDVPF